MYGREIIEHIPKVMRNLLKDFNILTVYEANGKTFNFQITPSDCFREMIRKPKRYECENAYFYTKSIRTMEYYGTTNRLVICRSTKSKPRTLKQLAAETYINSKEWIFTSILDRIQYNFKDIIFTDNFSETHTFYDILLIKFVFQYFLRKTDTNMVFRLICKCTYGLKNKDHVNVDSSESTFSLDSLCILCNAIESRTLRKYSYFENNQICVCED